MFADNVKCVAYNKTRFMVALMNIRELTPEDPSVFEPAMRQMCAEAGVALVFVSELPDTHLSGATRWVTKDKATIILSLRHKRHDHFWFSFFHEAGHIMHGGKKAIYLDEMNSWTNTEEVFANEFASKVLIPQEKYENFLNENNFTSASVRTFAQQLGIAPGIIVGRLQHEQIISWQSLNGLTRRFELTEVYS